MSSQDVRSLLRAELSTRRISHPYAAYANNKSNLLSCIICHLVIKSEALWEGHLRSANHRKNVQKVQQQQEHRASGEPGALNGARKRKAQEIDVDGDSDKHDDVATNGGRKRKAEEVDEDEAADGRKKTKGKPSHPSLPPTSQAMSGFVPASTTDDESAVEVEATSMPDASSKEQQAPSTNDPPPLSPTPEDLGVSAAPLPPPAAVKPAVDEDEWAAFEREVIPLTAQPPPHSTITISAAPVSASELAAQKAAEEKALRGRSREEEAEAEREEEGRRMEDEFELQEEMETRVRRLRERREMLRKGTSGPEGTARTKALGVGGGNVAVGDRDKDVGQAGIDGHGIVAEEHEEIHDSDERNNEIDDDDDDDEPEDDDEWGFS